MIRQDALLLGICSSFFFNKTHIFFVLNVTFNKPKELNIRNFNLHPIKYVSFCVCWNILVTFVDDQIKQIGWVNIIKRKSSQIWLIWREREKNNFYLQNSENGASQKSWKELLILPFSTKGLLLFFILFKKTHKNMLCQLSTPLN